MDVTAVIVEQLDSNGTLRTFRMQADLNDRLTVAFADEYDEPRAGPFHFFDERHEQTFQTAFAECKVRHVSNRRFRKDGDIFHFSTSWAGIPTEKSRLSYYALCLPEHAVPERVKFADPRSGREYKKAVVRDDQRRRFVLYLQCRSSHGFFDFEMETAFRILEDAFHTSEFRDDTSGEQAAPLDVYQYLLPRSENVVIQQFFSREVSMGDQYNVGQAIAVGPNARAENNTVSQVSQQTTASIDLHTLATELTMLRASMRKEATDIEHDQAVAGIGAAEVAAKKGDGAATIAHLKAGGKWALDVATKIGTSVAAKAIQTALGL